MPLFTSLLLSKNDSNLLAVLLTQIYFHFQGFLQTNFLASVLICNSSHHSSESRALVKMPFSLVKLLTHML